MTLDPLHRTTTAMTIGDLCCRDVDTAFPGETLRVVAQRMNTRAVGTLVVVDGGRRPVGIVTDRDLAVRAVGAGRDVDRTLVTEVMSAPVHTVSEETPIGRGLALMRARCVRRLVVVRAGGTLAGILSVDDALLLLAHHFHEVGSLLEKESPRQAAAS